jgi:hypothetical protein
MDKNPPASVLSIALVPTSTSLLLSLLVALIAYLLWRRLDF